MLRNSKKMASAATAFILLMSPVVTTNAAYADSTTVARDCANGVCGYTKYYGGRVRIYVSNKLSRMTHYNFKTNPGDQIELAVNSAGRGGYTFDREPGDSGTYSVQACDRGGIGARSTCTAWATFNWSSGGQESEGEQ